MGIKSKINEALDQILSKAMKTGLTKKEKESLDETRRTKTETQVSKTRRDSG